MSCHSDKCHCPDCCPCPPAGETVDKLTSAINDMKAMPLGNSKPIELVEIARDMLDKRVKESQKPVVHEIGVNVRGSACHEEMPEPTYRVKPFDWHIVSRSGTSYAVEEVRMVATSRNIKMAEELVAKLNERSKLRRQNDRLKDQIEGLQAANRSVEQATRASVHDDFRRVLMKQVNRSGWPGWEAKNNCAMKKFAKSVLDMLGIRPPDEWMGL